MKQLLAKLNSEKLKALYVMTPLKLYEARKVFTPEPDLGIHAYGGSHEKEYFFRTEIDLSKEYKYLLSADMTDYGYVDGDNLPRSKDNANTGGLNLRLDDESLRHRTLYIEGTINASSFDFGDDDNEKVVLLNLFGVKKGVELQIFEELVLEAYSLELEKNYRVSFFSYFAAIEAYVTLQLEPVRSSLHSELHHALEYLQLDDKLRLIFKHYSGVDDLNKIKLWSEFAGLFKTLKDKRNNIAHGKGVVDIKLADVQNIFLIICVLWSFTTNSLMTFDDIRKFMYPKPVKKK